MKNLVFYKSTIKDFISEIDDDINSFIDEMKLAAQECYSNIGEREVISWRKNAEALIPLFLNGGLPDDIIVAFEYQVPIGGGRIDCMLFGHGEDGQANIAHIELKQWSNDNVSSFYDNYTFHVIVDGYRNGTEYPTHPSRQVAGYQNCMLNYMQVFEKNNIKLYGMVYCYNYISTKEPHALLDEFYNDDLKQYPLFCKNEAGGLAKKLNELLGGGKGEVIFDEFINSEIHPTQRLYDVAATMFDNLDAADRIFTLVGDQIDVFNSILGAVKQTKQDEKTAIVVKGGPGTGKSVIAMRLLSELYKAEYNCNNVYYATRSTSLLHGWQNVLAGIARRCGNGDASTLIQSTFDFKPYRYGNKENGGDVLLVDEAHRIQYKSNDQTDSHRDDEDRTYLSQIMSLLYAHRVCVFFIDDKQSIVPEEIGLSTEIRKAAENYYNRMQIETDYFFNGTKKKLNQKKKDAEKMLDYAIVEGNLTKIEEANKTIDSINLLLELEHSKTDLEIKHNRIQEKKNNAVMSGDVDTFKECEKKQNSINRMLRLPRLDAKINKINVIECELRDQFRCNGSNNYLLWLDQLLYDNNNPNQIKLNTDSYEFGIFDDPNELYAKIRSLDDYAVFVDGFKSEKSDGFSYKQLQQMTKDMQFNQSARLIAGWCWDWEGKRNQETGDLKQEVDLTAFGFDFMMPWETKGQKPQGDFKFKYARDADSWCNQKEGVNQIGCIHSIQGWETDYVGVIIGPDIMWDKVNKRLCYNPKGNNHNLSKRANEKNNQLILNTYRVLLTRGKKGCFIFCCDPEVRDFFRRRM